jgi:hypothetical protein
MARHAGANTVSQADQLDFGVRVRRHASCCFRRLAVRHKEELCTQLGASSSHRGAVAQDGCTALHAVVACGNVDVAARLLAAGAAVDAKSQARPVKAARARGGLPCIKNNALASCG